MGQMTVQPLLSPASSVRPSLSADATKADSSSIEYSEVGCFAFLKNYYGDLQASSYVSFQ